MGKKKTFIELDVDRIGGEAPLTEAEALELDAYFRMKRLERAKGVKNRTVAANIGGLPATPPTPGASAST